MLWWKAPVYPKGTRWYSRVPPYDIIHDVRLDFRKEGWMLLRPQIYRGIGSFDEIFQNLDSHYQ